MKAPILLLLFVAVDIAAVLIASQFKKERNQ